MHIIEAIPAVTIPRQHPQILTYFSNEPLSRGSIALISLRNRSVPAVVLSSKDVDTGKIELKKASFTIKKITATTSKESILSQKDFEFLKWFADYYFLPLGLAIKTIIPDKILKAKRPIKELSAFENQSQSIGKAQKILCTYNKNNRFDLYIKEIKQTIANKKQSLIIFPDYINADFFKNLIDDYFPEKQISFFSSAQTQRQYFDEWLKIATGQSQIAIGTRSAVFLKFKDLGFIAVDEEEDQNLKSWDSKPYYNARECALKLADIYGAKIILSSQTPSIETYHKIESKISNKKTTKNIQNNLTVDMRDELRKGNEIISEDLELELEKISHNNGQASRQSLGQSLQQSSGQAIIFINRRGLATFIFCQECGFVVKCPNCDAPMVFHKEIKNVQQQLVCHYCNLFKKGPDLCPKCGGLKIKYSGIGSQKAEEAIKNLFPNLNIKRIDSETIPTSKELESALLDFKNKKIDILIGTQMMLNKIQLDADLVAILSIDTILNLPEFRADERIFQIVNQVKEFKKAEKTPLILQTFKPDQEIFKTALASDMDALYENELDTRKALGYPPFTQLIKLTFKHIDPKTAFSTAQKIVENLERQFNQMYKSAPDKKFSILGPSAGFIPRIKNKYIYNIVIKTNLDVKERNLILSIITTIDWNIDVDPVSLI